MDARHAILAGLDQADFFVRAYLNDLSEADLMVRPAPGGNHIAWQLGHLVGSERYLLDRAAPGQVAPLPAGFAERYSKHTAGSDNPGDFLAKDQCLSLGAQVRAQTRKIVESLAPADLDKPVDKVPPFVKTVGDTLVLIGSHWQMHMGQWVVVRRKLGRPPLF